MVAKVEFHFGELFPRVEFIVTNLEIAEEDRELVAGQLAATVVKTGGRLIKHARYYWLMLAESHLSRRSFGSMVRQIDALAVATG